MVGVNADQYRPEADIFPTIATNCMTIIQVIDQEFSIVKGSMTTVLATPVTSASLMLATATCAVLAPQPDIIPTTTGAGVALNTPR